jgi:hypothetical protein
MFLLNTNSENDEQQLMNITENPFLLYCVAASVTLSHAYASLVLASVTLSPAAVILSVRQLADVSKDAAG